MRAMSIVSRVLLCAIAAVGGSNLLASQPPSSNHPTIVPAPVADGTDEAIEHGSDEEYSSSDLEMELAIDSLDVPFNQYVDIAELSRAMSERDYHAAADLSIQLLEGERVLMRNHKSGIKAADLLAHLVSHTPIHHDEATMARILAAAKRTEDRQLNEKLGAMKSFTEASRGGKSGMIVETVDDSLAESIERMIHEAMLTGDNDLLNLFEARLPSMEGMRESNRAYLIDLVRDSKEQLSAKGETESNALGLLSSASRGLNREIANISRFGVYKQPDDISCGPTCCSMVLKYYGKSAGIGPLKTKAGTRFFEYRDYKVGMTTPGGIEKAIESYGVPVSVVKGSTKSLVDSIKANRPPILLVRSGYDTWHYIAVVGFSNDGERFQIADPGTGTKRNLSAAQIDGGWTFSHDYLGNQINRRSCRLCGGDGNLGWTKCFTCSGTGKLSATLPFGKKVWTKCTACSGQGKWSKKCNLCDGSGKEPDIYRKAVESAGVSGHTMIVPNRAP